MHKVFLEFLRDESSSPLAVFSSCVHISYIHQNWSASVAMVTRYDVISSFCLSFFRTIPNRRLTTLLFSYNDYYPSDNTVYVYLSISTYCCCAFSCKKLTKTKRPTARKEPGFSRTSKWYQRLFAVACHNKAYELFSSRDTTLRSHLGRPLRTPSTQRWSTL